MHENLLKVRELSDMDSVNCNILWVPFKMLILSCLSGTNRAVFVLLLCIAAQQTTPKCSGLKQPSHVFALNALVG